MYYIVGSGPSGIAAAQALLSRGLPVTMLDVGQTCDPARLAVVNELARQEPDAWESHRLAKIRGPAPDSSAPRKLCFGSDFPYATDAELSLEQAGTHCLHSYAKGGLSNVWGASVLPARESDFAGWPVSVADMAPHYAATGRLLGIAGVHDDLEAHFPFHAPPNPAPAASHQAQALLARMQANRDRLAQAGIVFGRSRLAVRTVDDEHGLQCRHCGLCLTGCPYTAIWNAETRLNALHAYAGFHYRGGVRVLAVESSAPGRVRIHGLSLAGGTAEKWEGRAVLLASGPLSTAAIVLRSLNVDSVSLRLQYQPYFLLPLLGLDNAPDVASERLHTLAQLYFKIRDPQLSPYSAHLQLYTFNSFIRERLDRLRRWIGPLAPWVRRLVEGRLLVVQGYLDSAEAEGMEMCVNGVGTGTSPRLRLRAVPSARVNRHIRSIVSRLGKHSRDIGAIPLHPLLQIGRPGEGNHIGGIFPMSRAPRDFETDSLGQLPGLPGVHLVDASVLPNLPSATYTYTIMANAHRIASEVAALKTDGG